jgi:Arc/MetJ-type ribon-helix-helix transcriptional regulator
VFVTRNRLLTIDNNMNTQILPSSMQSKLVGVRLSEPLYNEVRRAARKGKYGTMQEYIRETLRRATLSAAVEYYAGSLPNAKPITRESRDAAYAEFKKQKSA